MKRPSKRQWKQQKNRSRSAALVNTEDWTILQEDNEEEFIGYDLLEDRC